MSSFAALMALSQTQTRQSEAAVQSALAEKKRKDAAKQKAQEGRDLRNEGRVEDGKAPKTTEPGTGHPEK